MIRNKGHDPFQKYVPYDPDRAEAYVIFKFKYGYLSTL